MDQGLRLRTEAADHRGHPLLYRGIARNALDSALRVEADIAHLRIADGGAEETALRFVQCKSKVREIQDLAGLERGDPVIVGCIDLPICGVDFNDLLFHHRSLL